LIPQGDGVVLFEQIQKLLPLSRFEVGSGQESAARAAGSLLVVTLDLAVGLTLLAQEAALGTMEVVPQAPQGECLIERLDQIELVKPVVTEKLSHMGVVLLFDVCVVVLAVRTRATQQDFRIPPLEVGYEVRVEELRAVVEVEFGDGERQGTFQLAQACERGMGSPVPDGPHLGPAAVDVGGTQGPDDGSAETSPAEGHGIDLQCPGSGFRPRLASHRHLPLQGGQARAGDAALASGRAPRGCLAINLRGTDEGESRGLTRLQGTFTLLPGGNPDGKHLPGKPFAARLSGKEPDVLEHRDVLRAVAAGGPAR
jgi:hypothetical protein